MNDEINKVEKAVRECYSTWGESYHEDYYGDNAPYPPVHVDLLKKIIRESESKTLLDAGCGPASFLRYLAEEEMQLFGFDLTPEMVIEAKKVMSKCGHPPANFWQGSVLSENDFFIQDSPVKYDSAVCFGVLPHIPEEDDENVLRNLRMSISNGGIVMVEARNALFSLFTQNRYSYDFIRNELIRADDLLGGLSKDKIEISNAIENFKENFRMDIPPIRSGKDDEPGYDEVLSRTHIPFVLKKQFEKAGFHNTRIFFYHYHSLPPMLSDVAKYTFLETSLAMESAEDWRGYFMASAFILVGVAG